MGNLQRPEVYNMKDLTMDVKLRTCVDGSSYDFTGRKTFDTGFYRKNIGFGITDINIEINPSLQPAIEITFKDLYGNTIFGTQRGSNDDIDTSVLFNWPPPKFLFSFKGFLGREVTWMLNLKTTNVNFVPSDGSYEIKCSFVPNQWGFMADIPVLYLLACKRLRFKKYGKNEIKVGDCTFTTDSIFSYVKIGKQVEIKTKETTNQFDSVIRQLTGLRYSAAQTIYKTKKISINNAISGLVNNEGVFNFTNLNVPEPDGLDEDRINSLMLSSDNLSQLNTFLLLSTTKGKEKTPTDLDVKKYSKITKSFKYDDISSDGNFLKSNPNEDLSLYKKTVFDIIDGNLMAIDAEIKKRTYLSSKTQISKMTIKEIFNHIARDSAFILGSILEAGFQGYSDKINIESRNSADAKELIGKHFPLALYNGEEVPAIKDYGFNYGADAYEMKFVNEFIEAIGQGISEEMVSEVSADDSALQKPINSLELISNNPWKPFYSNIVENILIRSGIIAYVTRSGNPFSPGDYNTFFGGDADDLSVLLSLAKDDITSNLTKSILGQLSFEDKEALKRFCRFWVNLLSNDGLFFMKPFIDPKKDEDDNINTFFDLSPGSGKLVTSNEPVQDNILDYTIIIDEYTSENVKIAYDDYVSKGGSENSGQTIANILLKAANQKDNVQKTNFATASIRKMLDPFFNKPNNNEDDQGFRYGQPTFTSTNFGLIDRTSLSSYIVRNNELYYLLPKNDINSNVTNEYWYIMFANLDDSNKAKSKTSLSEEEMDQSLNHSDSKNPVGVVVIDTAMKPGDDSSEPLDRVNNINEAIEKGVVADYMFMNQVIKKPSTSTQTIEVDYDSYSFKRKVQDKEKIAAVSYDQNVYNGKIEAKNLAFVPYTHCSGDWGAPNLVFGPFCVNGSGDFRSAKQRAIIKAMCQSIIDRLSEIESERNEVVGNVIGKGSESRNLIYKQMHTIFHQWQVIATSIQNQDFCSNIIPDGVDLARSIEYEYGNCKNHVQKDPVKKLKEQSPTDGNTMFVYDYPLAPVNGKVVNVEDAIINIEPLYKPNGSTTVLNIIQQICTKNNFVFVPFPGDANSDNINDIYKPYPNPVDSKIMNYFHVLFTPTPETRSKLNNNASELITDHMKTYSFQNDAISIAFGAIDNQIVKGISVGTDASKPTAESIINLQRLADKESTNRQVAIDCSMLPVFEGRSYRATVEIIGNAQVYPMQYFYIEKMPMFGGLYQILKVTHSISPNNMTTKMEGVRMRFSANGEYGGIPPVTLDDLKELTKNVDKTMEVQPSQYVEAYPKSKNQNRAINGGEFTEDGTGSNSKITAPLMLTDKFIELVKDIKFTNLADVDAFFKANTDFNSFTEYFNATHMQKVGGKWQGVGVWAKDTLNSGILLNPQNTKIFEKIPILWPKGYANFFEIFTVWTTSISESGGLAVSEGANSLKTNPEGLTGAAANGKYQRAHPGLSYLFDGDGKQSYNGILGNRFVYDSLKNNSTFKTAHADPNLFTNRSSLGLDTGNVSDVWKGHIMPQNVWFDLTSNPKNILVDTDFNKFRGRGYPQHTGRVFFQKFLPYLFGRDDVLQQPVDSTSYPTVKSITDRWVSRVNTTYDTIIYQKPMTVIDKILDTSYDWEWNYLFNSSDHAVACAALRCWIQIQCNNSFTIDMDLSLGRDKIMEMIYGYAGSPTCSCNLVRIKTGSKYQYAYAQQNLERVMQIVATIGKIPPS